MFVIQKGLVKLSAKSKAGKEATLGILSDKDFVGEDCLAAQALHIASASAITDCDLLRIENCNFSERRLARILLLLAKKNTPHSVIPELNQTTLAQMVGTTRSRVSFFMNRFRSLGFIDYGDCRRGLHVRRSLALYARGSALTLAHN